MTVAASGAPLTRRLALLRVATMYVAVQALSYVLLQASCSPLTFRGIWLKGALGPLAAYEALPRLPYHAWASNALFIGWCLLVLLAPFAYVARPRRGMLALSAAGVVVWCLFGLGFAIDHM